MNLVRSWPQGQAGPTPLGWRLPQPLMPPRVNGWPMGVVPSSDAEALLESAVAWWDASRYRAGDRFLRNQGVAGELLDLRLGSSIAPNTNDPTWLGVQDSGYVYLPGVTGNYLTVPDEAALDITGDIDIRVRVLGDAWNATQGLVSKWQAGQLSYDFSISSGNVLNFRSSADGTATTVNKNSAAHQLVNGQPYWLRLTLDVDNGAGGSQVRFYKADDSLSEPTAWTEITPAPSPGGATSIFSGTSTALLGQIGSSSLVGRYHRAIVKNGIDGPSVLDVNCDAITSGAATSFTATTGQTVTINRSTTGRKSVAQPGRGRGRATFLLGTDDYFEVPADRVWQHQLLNFGQDDSFTVVAVVTSWNNPSGIFHMFAAKGDSTNAGFPGFYLFRGNGTAATRLQINDNSIAIGGAQTQNISNGARSMVAGVRNSSARQFGVSINGAVIVPITDTVSGLSNSRPFRIGNRSSGNDFADMEFTAAAIFRRALTAAEITAITRYYGA